MTALTQIYTCVWNCQSCASYTLLDIADALHVEFTYLLGNDEYVVAASDKEEAMKELENRPDNETIYPASEWLVTYIGEA